MIYGVLAPDAQMVKFGCSNDPQKRLTSFRTGSPHALHLVFSLPWPDSMERIIHDTFSEHRRNGEWFLISSRMVEFLDALDRGGNDKMALGRALLARSRFLRSCGVEDPLFGPELSWDDDDPPEKPAVAQSPPNEMNSMDEEIAAAVQSRRKSLERTKRWREANREKYNAYMREYRRRK